MGLFNQHLPGARCGDFFLNHLKQVWGYGAWGRAGYKVDCGIGAHLWFSICTCYSRDGCIIPMFYREIYSVIC